MHVLRYAFDGEVYAFTAGQFATQPGRREPCLVYVTFGGKIQLYYRLDVHQIPNVTLQGTLGATFDRATVGRLLYDAAV